MFRVECTSCKAAYQVDERRVPAKGLMMKCPKCRASFLVSPPDTIVDLTQAAPMAVANDATAPLPDVQPKPVVPSPREQAPESASDLPAPVKKSFELPATRGRSRNDETMIGVAPSAAQGRKVGSPSTEAQSVAGLPATKSLFDDFGAELPDTKLSDTPLPEVKTAGRGVGAELPASKTLAAGAALPSASKSAALPSIKSSERAGGPITPLGIRKVSRISLPSLSNKGGPATQAPEPKPAAPVTSFTSISEPDLPQVFGGAAVAPSLPSSSDDEFELPDVFGGKSKTNTSQQVDMPIFGTSRQELPAIKVTSINDDLPAALTTSTASLPAVSVGRRASVLNTDAGAMSFGDVSLDDDGERVTQSTAMVDLDSEGVALETVPPSGRPDAADLPDIFGVDLPSIPASLGVHAEPAFDDAGLGFGELDLPALDNKSGEPPLSGLSAQLPSFAPSDPPPGHTSSAPPSFRARQDSFGDFEGLPSFGEANTSTSQAMGAVGKRGADVDHDPFEDDSFSLGSSHDKPVKSTRGDVAPPSRVANTAAGSREYGQVSLDESSGSLDADMDDEMEFGGIPQAESEPPAGVPLSQKAPSVSQEPKPATPEAKPELPRDPAKPKSRRALKFGAVAAVLLLGGAALSLDSRIGPFGAFVIGDLVHKGEHQALLQQKEDAVNEARLNDQYAAIVAADFELEQASNSAKRFAPLQTATATQHLATVLRFGGPSKAQSTAQVLLAELQTQGVEPNEYATARAINAILTQGPVTPEQTLQPLPNTLLAQAVRGEYWLLVGDAAKAAEVWAKAVEMKRSAWTLFGAARALFLGGHFEAANKQAASVLQITPDHAGAVLLMADSALRAGKYGDVKPEVLARVATSESKYSTREVALAHTLNGELELSFGKVGKALEGFEAALKVQPNDTRALTASGNAMLSSGRYAAALARFQAAKTADSRALAPALGEVRANLALQQADVAKQLIAGIQRTHAKELEVNAVLGAVALAIGEVEPAKKVLLDAANTSKGVAPELAATPAFQRVAVEIYVSLAAAYSRSGHPDQAAPILRDALTQLPKSAALRTALGDVASSQGQYDKALVEYGEAQKLAPNELEPLFKLGSVLRRLKRFDEATQAFDKVAHADPEYLGLPLERGLILEQSGKITEALMQYEAALKHTPGDLDVQLRVGCGRVASGNAQGARDVLKDVIDKRPKSAEAAYCLGRALFTEGSNLEALRWLRTAVELDGNSAHYHLHLGWVASDAAQVALAQKELNRALTLDPGLADAYWQRGVLNLKQGAARDAMLDFKKTLELKPDRVDANADMGQALSQLGKEKDAIPYWEKAVAAEPNNTVWLFRYGKLLIGRQQMAKGTELLQRAITLVAKTPTKPNWLWQAHYWTALGLGDSPLAVKHWREYLSLSSLDSPYRDEAKRALKRAGQTYDGD